jgi:hypothetical protein
MKANMTSRRSGAFPQDSRERLRGTSMLPFCLARGHPRRRRPIVIHSVVTLGTTVDGLLADDAALTDFMRRHVGAPGRASGTCRRGSGDDPTAVTDPHGRAWRRRPACLRRLTTALHHLRKHKHSDRHDYGRIADFIRQGRETKPYMGATNETCPQVLYRR